jgi:N-acetylmuramoyl-L-alanine amidase
MIFDTIKCRYAAQAASLCMLFLCMLLWSGQAIAVVNVEGVRLAARPELTRVVLDLDGPARHSVFTLKRPDRVVIDLRPGKFALRGKNLPAGRGVVKKIRGANRSDGSVRVVLDLAGPATPRAFVLPPGNGAGHRLVIDVAAGPSRMLVDVAPEPEKLPKAAPTPQRTSPKAGRDLVIALDPGHGGKDPGAHGRKGLREKDAVLAISRRLSRIVDREPGMHAVMTRTGDEFIPLRTRMERARAAQADLFVSVHADAFSDRRVRGATVYVLSQKGATDEAARRLAERENAADLIGGVKLADKDYTLASVLLDLSQNAALSNSFEAGERILSELGQIGKLRKTKVQQAPFLVLKSPDLPSILVETAYISNPDDERRLRDGKYQEKIARAIFNGVKSYFYANPPKGTLVAQLDAGQERFRHVISNGETLSQIAVRYNTDVRVLRRENNIRGDKILIGQVLTIPTAVRM